MDTHAAALTRRKRRWLQFRLRTLLGVVTIAAAICAVAEWWTELPRDLKLMQGKWICTLCQDAGELKPEMTRTAVVRGSKIVLTGSDGVHVITIALKGDRDPKQIHWTEQGEFFGQPMPVDYDGIYSIDRSTLMICLQIWTPGQPLTAFESTAVGREYFLIFKRDQSDGSVSNPAAPSGSHDQVRQSDAATR